MAKAPHIEVDAKELLRSAVMTVRVKGMRRMRARFWVAKRLLLLAAWVSGFRIEIHQEGGE